MKKLSLFLMSLALLFTLVACSTKVTVTFDPNNGDATHSVEVVVGTTISFPEEPVKEGYAFKGWFLDNQEFTSNSTFSKNVTLVAKWEKILKEFTISYDAGEGANMSANAPTKFKEDQGSSIVLPKPTKSGYLFLGWFDLDGNKVEKLENKNYELVAKWEVAETFEVIFINEGEIYETLAALEGSMLKDAELPLDPEKEDYRFEGWYLGDTKYDFSSVLTGDLELVAKWKQVKKVIPYSVSTPENILLYNNNKGDQNKDGDNIDDHNEFAIWNLSYLVGDDNGWTFKPNVTFYKFQLDEDGNLDQSAEYEKDVKQDKWTYVVEIYKYNLETEAYDILVDNNDTTIIDSIDYENCVIDFAEGTEERAYKVKVYPTELRSGQLNNLDKYSITLNIEVVDGYNVYDAKEFAYANNRTDEFKQAWEDFKVDNGLLTNYYPSKLILHTNINISRYIT